MKKLFLTPACILFIALAFAQTTLAASTRTYANKTGSITAFEPGRSITINANVLTHETKYLVASNVQYSRKGGGAVNPGLVRTGSRVELGFNSAGKVDRISLVEEH
jgi:hypothetical protein